MDMDADNRVGIERTVGLMGERKGETKVETS